MRTRRPDLPIPEALDDAVMKCLKKKVADRPHSANELADMLEAIPRDGLPTSYPLGVARRPPPTTRPPPARERDGAAANGEKKDARDEKKEPAAPATGTGHGAKPPMTSN